MPYEDSTGRAPARPILALLPEERAGRITTASVGAVAFQATLGMRPGEEMPSDPILGDPAPGARYYALARDLDPFSATLRISCEIRALRKEQLTTAVDTVLRSVTAHAALTEAVLETRAVHLAEPSVTPPALMEEVALELSEHGLRPSFGPSWTPAPEADVSVGARRLERVLEEIFRAYPVLRLERRSDTHL